MSSDPKPREGTETGQRSTPALVDFRVVRPKTPRGDGNQVSNGGGNLAATGRSSDPKPREGTETWDICCPPGEMLSEVVRPKTPRGDGNRMDPGELQMVREVVRPKTPRGDGNWIALTGLALILVVVRPKTPRGDGNSTSISLTSPGEKITSSDPKPRERTETRRRSRRCRCPNRRVVRPKTPRGDGNLERVTADGTIETSRQTQNPERGRKPSAQHR
ncbi:Uncharacterised protein [Mycobacterium tuberculosis]|nr:Uncharacterised protein [Mycobacterium tuberculosis]CNW57967.1 Uncharacterised protein [Mycobacterium tuberculosis]CNW91644.1 Uncharacterised protein [Mycobacterium tuberculosis]CNW92268.1 Uncharacterised protein [Mycobacterium tuberculosis]CNW93103.1 Uncharacterised protein [Mycobacterium tuberculosis]